MRNFSDGDRVKVIDAAENGKHLIGKTGTAKQPQGQGYDYDDVIVWFNGGESGYFKEYQLQSVAPSAYRALHPQLNFSVC
jgi:hypothetical protein